eukprot:gnl/Spiro4/14244_TR7660_c0_g1_i1.p1 gnl/Spiro4/14244_TR7660_c0_g1~~gnl/Spiro4/14244_TR7660_c0_g1_i1.p1  ORF type:complete len:132 (+),score=36.18 gnl/Spiro4/14244_TR7660_c0_g1_i1:53-448(+)
MHSSNVNLPVNGGSFTTKERQMDLVGLLTSLEQHWHVLEDELAEIDRDIGYTEQCIRKYGEYYSVPLQYLHELRKSKKQKMVEILQQLDTFNSNLQSGKRLVKSLERSVPLTGGEAGGSAPPASASRPAKH